MEPTQRRTDIPVLMLHNLDPSWDSAETAVAVESAQKIAIELKKEGHPVVVVPVTDAALGEVLQPYAPEDYVVFNWCEELPGCPRSDATVAGILESLSFAYTGSSSQVLSLSWDKMAVKDMLKNIGVPTPDGRVIEMHSVDDWDRFPAIVKPSLEHCSFGISADAVVMDRQELKRRVAFVQDTFRQPALVEAFIDGREFHVTLWGNGVVHVLPAAEMDFGAFENVRDRLCSFDSKFTPGSVDYEKIELRIPAALDPMQVFTLNQTALRAYRAMGCRDFARIDLRLENDLYYVLDINPNADLSADTTLVYTAEAAGLSYGAIASLLVNLAAQRHPIFSQGS
jgi:D-alanine-D-alanine ligase